MDDLVAFMKERRRADEAAAAAWAERSGEHLGLGAEGGDPADPPRDHGRADVVRPRGRAEGADRVRLARADHQDAGILLTPSGELWQYDNEWPMSARLTATIPAFRTAEGAALMARCEWILDNVIEAFADTLDRNGIEIAELEDL